MNTYMKIVVLTSVASLALASCGKKDDVLQTERTIAVETQVIQPANEDVVKSFTGSLEGEHQAVLYSKLAEAVEKVNVHEGQLVKAGDVIVSLDKFGPSARYNESKSVFLNAEKTYSKMEYLYKEGAISESQHDEAKTGYEVAKSNYDAVARLVDITSPIDGTVTSVDVSAGDFVQMGQKLATIATIGKLRIKFGVNSGNLGYFSKGADVTISSDVLPETASGKVISVAESADPFSRAFQVEAQIDNEGSHFKPGMFVKVNIIQQKLVNVITIPRSSVVSLDNKYVAFTVVNGQAVRHELTLGEDLDGRVVIQSGISAGDTLVTLGQTYLEDGFRVTLALTGKQANDSF